MSHKKDKEREYTSFEEYLEEFYPTSLEEELRSEKDPHEFGVKLAKLSLSRFDQLKEVCILAGYEINEVQLYGGKLYDVADVTLVRHRQRDGSSLWAIHDRGACLNKDDGTWEQEPIPSSRDDDFIRRCRFSTPDEAIAAWRKLDSPSRFERRLT